MRHDVPFCMTDTLDKLSPSGSYRYYHNLQQDNRRVRMRPRLPVRFDVNDAEFLKMEQGDKKRAFQAYYNRNRKSPIDGKRLFQWRRTGFSQFNTILMYSLSLVLIAASAGHMKRIVRAMQDDPTLTHKDRVLFRINFILSFLLALFLLCFVAVSVLELFHNSGLNTITRDQIQYKDLSRVRDGNMFHLRTILLMFVGGSMLLALAETINLSLMRRDRPVLLVLLVPVFFCSVLLAYLFLFQRRNGNVV